MDEKKLIRMDNFLDYNKSINVNDKTFEKLMEKMNRKRGRIEAYITTADYEN